MPAGRPLGEPLRGEPAISICDAPARKELPGVNPSRPASRIVTAPISPERPALFSPVVSREIKAKCFYTHEYSYNMAQKKSANRSTIYTMSTRFGFGEQTGETDGGTPQYENGHVLISDKALKHAIEENPTEAPVVAVARQMLSELGEEA